MFGLIMNPQLNAKFYPLQNLLEHIFSKVKEKLRNQFFASPENSQKTILSSFAWDSSFDYIARKWMETYLTGRSQIPVEIRSRAMPASLIKTIPRLSLTDKTISKRKLRNGSGMEEYHLSEWVW